MKNYNLLSLFHKTVEFYHRSEKADNCYIFQFVHDEDPELYQLIKTHNNYTGICNIVESDDCIKFQVKDVKIESLFMDTIFNIEGVANSHNARLLANNEKYYIFSTRSEFTKSMLYLQNNNVYIVEDDVLLSDHDNDFYHSIIKCKNILLQNSYGARLLNENLLC